MSRLVSRFSLRWARITYLKQFEFILAAERALNGGDLQDCRDALINGAVDTLAAYNRSIGIRPTGMCTPIHGQMKFFPLFVLGLLKHVSMCLLARLILASNLACFLCTLKIESRSECLQFAAIQGIP